MSDYGIAWIKQTLVMNTDGFDGYQSMAVDSSGNSYVCYQSDSTASGGTYVAGADIVVFKMNTNGSLVWIKEVRATNTTSDEENPDIAVDSNGNVYVTYTTNNSTVSGGTRSGGKDVVVFKMDTNGNLVWLRQQRSYNTTGNDLAPYIAATSNGDIYISFYTGGTVSGGTFRGNADIVVFKMDTNGNTAWIKQLASMNTSGGEISYSLKTDNNGNICVLYITSGTVSGGTLMGGYDIVVSKMDSNGNVLWIKQQSIMNTTSDDLNANIAIDSSNNIIVSYLSLGVASGGTNIGSYDLIVFKMDPNGNIMWIKQTPNMNSTSAQYFISCAVDANGNIFIIQQTDGTFSGGTITGISDIALVVMDKNGNVFLVKQQSIMNTTQLNNSPKIAVDGTGNVYVSYYTNGTVSGGTRFGSYDIVVMKFVPIIIVAPPTIDIRPFVESQKITYYWGFSDPSTISSISLSCIGPSGGVARLTSNDRQYTFSNLTNASNYAGAIVGFDNKGNQSISSLYRTVQPGSLPNPPLNVVFTKVGDRIQVTWDAPAVQDSEIKWYFLNSTDNSYSFGIEPFKREFTSTSISAGLYTWALRAVNDSGYGTAVYSSPITF